MKIGLISDLHLLSKTPEQRCDNILEHQWTKFREVLSICKKEGINHLLQAGDFFDKPRDWETLHQTISLLQSFPSVRIYCVEGQHDRYMRNDDTVTNLSLLHRLGLVTILKNSIEFGQFDVHGVNFEDGMDIDKTLNEIELNTDNYNILVIHAPISDAPLFPGHEFSKAGILLKKHKEFDLILCGDIHKSFIISNKDRHIVNTGCMIRKERNEYNEIHTPHFLIFDVKDNSITKQVLPHQTFKKIFSQQELVSESDILGDFVEAIQNPVSDEMDVFKRITRFLLDNNIEDGIHQWILEVSKDEK
jgi:DNA repair exonuclease SbcCD nuclease subunit